MSTPKKPSSPFAGLEALRDQLPARSGSAGPRSAAEGRREEVIAKPAPEVSKKGPARAVVRMERKQRGGKEVTVIEKLGLPAKELEHWCRELKQAMGCGGAVDGDTIVLQGDLRPRLAAVLTAKGVGKVTIG